MDRHETWEGSELPRDLAQRFINDDMGGLDPELRDRSKSEPRPMIVIAMTQLWDRFLGFVGRM